MVRPPRDTSGDDLPRPPKARSFLMIALGTVAALWVSPPSSADPDRTPCPTITTPDSPSSPCSAPISAGIVAAISALIAETGGNIYGADQHTDRDSMVFLQRIELNGDIDWDAFRSGLAVLVERFGFQWSLHAHDRRHSIVVACSGELYCAADLLSRVALGELDCDVHGGDLRQAGGRRTSRNVTASPSSSSMADSRVLIVLHRRQRSPPPSSPTLPSWSCSLATCASFPRRSPNGGPDG